MSTQRAVRVALILVAATACSRGDDVSAPPQSGPAPERAPPPEATARPRAEHPDPESPVAAGGPLELAAQILRVGADALPDEEATDEAAAEPTTEIRFYPSGVALDTGRLRSFLERPWIDSAVQFSCSSTLHEDESDLVSAMELGPDAEAVVALAALVRVRAPRHIVAQWETLCRLGLRHGDDPAWRGVLADLRRPFSPADIDSSLAAEPPPPGKHDDAPALEWSARAAGVTGHRAALPRLTELSRNPHLDVSLAAERSLEDFPGPEADAALARCVLGWRYDAFIRAGNALAERDPALLRNTLLAAEVPEGCRRAVGLLLAKLDSAEAVPHLCASVGRTAIVDGKMFDAIERLSTADHWDLVEALPGSVRDEQRERAADVLAAVRTRLGR